MDRVNVFNPFDSRPDNHEDRLTWAFLVALKYDPFLQNFLHELVVSRLPAEYRKCSHTWEPARIVTQTEWIESSTTRFVSALITDAPVQEEIRVGWSVGDRRYDGVIEYPDHMTLIIENKPLHGDVREEQLSPSKDSLPDDIIDDVKLHELAVCLEWSEILEGVLHYIISLMPSFGSREIARDFLSFVEETHPMLTPYRTFVLCGDRPEALERRIIGLIANLASRTGLDGDTWSLYRPGKIAQKVGIFVSETKPWRLEVYLWPASTAWQADCFRDNVDRESFLSLSEHGWQVWPSLNFSYMGKKLIWGNTVWKTRRYLEHFFGPGTGKYGRKWFEGELSPEQVEEWQREGLIDTGTPKGIERERQTARQFLDVNPEFEICRAWDREAVIELEKQGKLEEDIINALAIPLATWGEVL